MRKVVGIILTVIGAIASVITGVQVMDDSDSFSFLGFDVVVSQADYTPFIISLALLIIGIVLWSGSRK